MASEMRLATRDIRAVFEEEIVALGGAVSEVFDDEPRLFARSILQGTREVGPGDRVQGGVAIRASAHGLCVHPFVFRQVCRNGAIMAMSLQTWRVEQVELRDPDEVVVELREAVRSCASEVAFSDAARCVRSTRDADVDRALALLPYLARRARAVVEGFIEEVWERLEREDGGSAFGVLNAVTSLARDTRDPQRRWDLEQLGGALAASAGGPRRPSPIRAAMRLARV